MPEKPTSIVSINCGVNSKTCTPTSEVEVLSPPFGRNVAVKFKNEKKTNYYYCMVVVIINKKIIQNLFMMWSEKKDIQYIAS